MKATEIIAETKALPPEGFAEVSAFILKTGQEDPALQNAIGRKHSSTTGKWSPVPMSRRKPPSGRR